MNNSNTENGASVTGLVAGIAHDANELLKQQFALLRHELHESVQKIKQSAVFLAMGAGLLSLGALLVCFMLVHLLSWAAPQLPLWACFAIVGLPIAALGSLLCFAGIHQVRTSNLLPDQSAQAVKENIRWIRNPR